MKMPRISHRSFGLSSLVNCVCALWRQLNECCIYFPILFFVALFFLAFLHLRSYYFFLLCKCKILSPRRRLNAKNKNRWKFSRERKWVATTHSHKWMCVVWMQRKNVSSIIMTLYLHQEQWISNEWREIKSLGFLILGYCCGFGCWLSDGGICDVPLGEHVEIFDCFLLDLLLIKAVNWSCRTTFRFGMITHSSAICTFSLQCEICKNEPQQRKKKREMFFFLLVSRQLSYVSALTRNVDWIL